MAEREERESGGGVMRGWLKGGGRDAQGEECGEAGRERSGDGRGKRSVTFLLQCGDNDVFC